MLLLAESVDPASFERLGVAGIVCLILLAGWVREYRERKAERSRNDEMTDRLIALAERQLPIMDRVDRALDRMERQ